MKTAIKKLSLKKECIALLDNSRQANNVRANEINAAHFQTQNNMSYLIPICAGEEL